MKKILKFGGVLFLLISILGGLMGTKAADYITISASPTTAKVGDKITFTIAVSNPPVGANRVILYISTSVIPNNPEQARPYLKDWWDAPAQGASSTHTYVWDTQAAGSTAGNHNVVVQILNINNPDVEMPVLLLTDKVTSYSLAAASSSTIANPPPSSSVSFDLGDLGQVIFPSTKVGSAKELIVVIIKWLIGIMGALAVIAIVYSGVMYITSGADTARAENAKKNLTWAIIGIVLVLLSYFLVELVAKVIGG